MATILASGGPMNSCESKDTRRQKSPGGAGNIFAPINEQRLCHGDNRQLSAVLPPKAKSAAGAPESTADSRESIAKQSIHRNGGEARGR
jgi:hypothetical protein